MFPEAIWTGASTLRTWNFFEPDITSGLLGFVEKYLPPKLLPFIVILFVLMVILEKAIRLIRGLLPHKATSSAERKKDRFPLLRKALESDAMVGAGSIVAIVAQVFGTISCILTLTIAWEITYTGYHNTPENWSKLYWFFAAGVACFLSGRWGLDKVARKRFPVFHKSLASGVAIVAITLVAPLALTIIIRLLTQ